MHKDKYLPLQKGITPLYKLFSLSIVSKSGNGLTTVSAQIERHFRLELQETLFKCTVVSFGKKSLKIL